METGRHSRRWTFSSINARIWFPVVLISIPNEMKIKERNYVRDSGDAALDYAVVVTDNKPDYLLLVQYNYMKKEKTYLTTLVWTKKLYKLFETCKKSRRGSEDRWAETSRIVWGLWHRRRRDRDESGWWRLSDSKPFQPHSRQHCLRLTAANTTTSVRATEAKIFHPFLTSAKKRMMLMDAPLCLLFAAQLLSFYKSISYCFWFFYISHCFRERIRRYPVIANMDGFHSE